MTVTVEIKEQRGRHYAFAGDVKLTRGFKTFEMAKQEYEDNKPHYDYWANSAGVSIENSMEAQP